MHVSAPGKLVLLGEWSILELGNPAIVAAVNKRVHAELAPAPAFEFAIDDFGIKGALADFDGKELRWRNALPEDAAKKLAFPKAAVEVALRYLGEAKPAKIHSWGELSQLLYQGRAQKLGFGSSAAAIVAIVAGTLAHHGFPIDSEQAKETIFKLSTIAHYYAQGKTGSAVDVAASAYGGVVLYERFDPAWLSAELAAKPLKEVVDQPWPRFRAQPLAIPPELRLLIGWTTGETSTSAAIKQMDQFKARDRASYDRLYNRIADVVRAATQAWERNDYHKVRAAIRENARLLGELTKSSGVNIETPLLKALADTAWNSGAAGKLSGAGGGECGFAVCWDPVTAGAVKIAWEQN
ncbi:MAG TPA: phosphomevalonate kinase, partial [archaeon]|nr:phosphomevalonate kinase [archaeon]